MSKKMDIQAAFTIPFTQIQNSVIESPFFKQPIDKMVYITLLKFAFNKGKAYPSIKTISIMQNVSENTVRKAIKRLEEMNLIKVEKRKDEKNSNLTNLYHLYDLSYEYTMEYYIEQKENEENESHKTVKNKENRGVLQKLKGGTSNSEGGVLQKLKGGTSKVEGEEYLLNNTKINNTNMNNNLSINEEMIQKLDVPISVQKQLILNIDRLIDDNINVFDIELIYNAYKDVVNEYEFSLILSNVLKSTKGKIRDIDRVLTVSMQNYLKSIRTSNNEEKQHDEVIPDWFVDLKRKKKDNHDYDFNRLGNDRWIR